MAEAQRDEIAKLEALYAANPEGRVFTHLAEAYRKAGELERAQQILNDGLARHPDSATGYVVLGRVAFDRSASAEARAAFSRALELDGGNLVAHRYLGELAMAAGERTEALLHFREVLARNPSDEQLQQTVRELGAPAPPLPPEPPSLSPQATSAPSVAAESPEFTAPTDALPGDLATFAGRQYESLTGRTWEPQPAEETALDAELADLENLLDNTEEASPAGTSNEPWSWGNLEPATEPLPELADLSADPEADLAAESDGGELPTLDLGDLGEQPAEEYPALPALELEQPAASPEDAGLDTEPAAEEAGVADLQFGESELPPATLELPRLDGGEELGDAVSELESADTWSEPAPAVFQPFPEAHPVIPELTEPETEWPDAAADAITSSEAEPAADAGTVLPPAEPLEDVEEGGFAVAVGGEVTPAASEDDVVTETMAELYRSQGFHDRAADVYRSLLRRSPDDPRLLEKLAEVEAERTGTEEQAAISAGMVPEQDESGDVWMRDVESAFTGAGGANASGATPYAWDSAADEPAARGMPVSAYFRALLDWKPGQAAAASQAPQESEPEPEPPVEPVSEIAPPPAEEPSWRPAEPEPVAAEWTPDALEEERLAEPADAPAEPPEFLLDEPVAAEATASEPLPELMLEDAALELEPEPEFGGWTPAMLGEPEPPMRRAPEPTDLMPWEITEPPALSLPALESEPAAPEPTPEPSTPEPEPAEEDEDLEMFRSWLQSLKK